MRGGELRSRGRDRLGLRAGRDSERAHAPRSRQTSDGAARLGRAAPARASRPSLMPRRREHLRRCGAVRGQLLSSSNSIESSFGLGFASDQLDDIFSDFILQPMDFIANAIQPIETGPQYG